MKDIKTIPTFIKEEKKASKEYKRKANYERRYGSKKLAEVFDELARDEKKHSEELKKLYRL